MVTEETKSIQRRILELQTEHRDLDEVVNTLSKASVKNVENPDTPAEAAPANGSEGWSRPVNVFSRQVVA